MSTDSAALDLVAALVIEDGRRWGEVAAPFQWEDARAVLDDASGTPYHFLTRSRGGSKTADLGGMAVAAMLAQLPRGARAFGLAADREQGRLLIDSIAGYEARTPELKGALRIDAYRVVATRTGASLEVLPADAPGAWGLRPHLLIVDELAQWADTPGPRRLWEAASSAVAKIADARMAVLTTAGDPAHWSRKVLDHALADPLWRVHEVSGPAPWLDRVRLEEQRRRLPESIYRRLFENEWVAAEDRLTTVDDLSACTILDGPLAAQEGTRYLVAVDLGLKSDRTVAAVCHAERVTRTIDDRELMVGSTVFLDRMEVWQGTRAEPVLLADVEEWVAQASAAFNAAPVVLDPWQAVGLTQRLRRRGLHVEEFTFSNASVGRLAATLHLLLRNRALALPDDPELLDELANVRLRETSPGVLRMDHDSGRHDDRAIALALAAHHLVADAISETGAGVVGAVVRGAVREPLTVDEQIAAYERERPRWLQAWKDGPESEPGDEQDLAVLEAEARRREPGYRDPRYD